MPRESDYDEYPKMLVVGAKMPKPPKYWLRRYQSILKEIGRFDLIDDNGGHGDHAREHHGHEMECSEPRQGINTSLQDDGRPLSDEYVLDEVEGYRPLRKRPADPNPVRRQRSISNGVESKTKTGSGQEVRKPFLQNPDLSDDEPEFYRRAIRRPDGNFGSELWKRLYSRPYTSSDRMEVNSNIFYVFMTLTERRFWDIREIKTSGEQRWGERKIE